MTQSKLRLATALALATVLLAAVAGAIILGALDGALERAGVDRVAAVEVRRAVLIALVLVGMALLAVALASGRAVAAALNHMRGAVLLRARGDDAPMPRSHVRELAELASATERLSARASSREAELERGGAEIAVLLDAITEGILQLDPQGRVVRANPSARALLGMDTGGIGQNIATHVRHAELRTLLQRVATENVTQSAEVTLGERRLLVSARPLDPSRKEHGGGAVVAFVDLTEIRRLEGVRRDFVANVSHELKTPLTSIRGYVETLLHDASLPPDMARQFLEVVHRNADRLHHIVDDLLDLSRLESGGWRPELLEVDAASVVADVWSTCSERAAQRRIVFQPPSGTAPVLADPSGLRQVLANLLDNAIRYTPEGGRIEVAVVQAQGGSTGRVLPAQARNGSAAVPTDGAYVTIEVRDTGIGIPTDALARVFERFYRVDPARSRAEGGTGLGLSIVKHLVESMGGDVSAQSELGKGTVIRFRLPAAA